MPQIQRIPKGKLAIEDFDIPANRNDWDALVKAAKLKSRTIHDFEPEYLGSGSEINEKHFCLLRVIFPRKKIPLQLAGNIARYGLAALWERAQEIIESDGELKRYLEIIDTDTQICTLSSNHPNWPGTFKPVRVLQEQTMTVDGIHDRDRNITVEHHHPRPKRSKIGRSLENIRAIMKQQQEENPFSLAEGSEEGEPSGATGGIRQRYGSLGSDNGHGSQTNPPAAEDEATPNAALIILLQLISDLVPGRNVEWVLNRFLFSPKFKKGFYNAHTDGGLRRRGTNVAMAIVEAKKATHSSKHRHAILMQEAAEEVGWLMKVDKGSVPSFNNQ